MSSCGNQKVVIFNTIAINYNTIRFHSFHSMLNTTRANIPRRLKPPEKRNEIITIFHEHRIQHTHALAHTDPMKLLGKGENGRKFHPKTRFRRLDDERERGRVRKRKGEEREREIEALRVYHLFIYRFECITKHRNLMMIVHFSNRPKKSRPNDMYVFINAHSHTHSTDVSHLVTRDAQSHTGCERATGPNEGRQMRKYKRNEEKKN